MRYDDGDRVCEYCWGDSVHEFEIHGSTVVCKECGRELGEVNWNEERVTVLGE